MNEENQPDFAFGKKISFCESVYGDLDLIYKELIPRLLDCIKQTNRLNNVECEFFRLDFRPQSLDEKITREFPMDTLVLDLKWGSKKELNIKSQSEKNEEKSK